MHYSNAISDESSLAQLNCMVSRAQCQNERLFEAASSRENAYQGQRLRYDKWELEPDRLPVCVCLSLLLGGKQTPSG